MMTDKEAFVSGIKLFCKRAGFDADDEAQVERLLLMHPDKAAPIIKAASISVQRIKYVRAGQRLEKLGEIDINKVMQEARGQIESPDVADTALNWGRKQKDLVAAGGNSWWQSPSDAKNQQSWQQGDRDAAISRGRKENEEFQAAKTPAAQGVSAEAGAAPATTAVPDDAHITKYESDYEGSRAKTLGMPLQRYTALRMQHRDAEAAGQAFTPLEDFMAEQRSMTQNREERRINRSSMRQYGLDMAPGALAKMTDAQIQQRSGGDPGRAVSLRRAVRLAKSREAMQGGVGARMGAGFSTGAPGFSTGTAATQAAAQTPPPASSPSAVATPTTSSSPPTDASMAAARQSEVDPAGEMTAGGGTPPTSTASSMTDPAKELEV